MTPTDLDHFLHPPKEGDEFEVTLTSWAYGGEVVGRLPDGRAVFVPYAIPGGDELPDSIVPYLAGHQALLLGNHGAVAYAPTLTEALFGMETVELNARIYLTAHQLGHINFLTDAQIAALRERYGV